VTETIRLDVGGMTCEGCSNRVRNVLEGVKGVSSADVNHLDGVAMIDHEGVSKDLLSGAIRSIGYSVDGQSEEFHWSDRSVWRRAANNTKWCLVGCAIGEFGTLAYYSYSGITADLELYSRTWYFFAILPLINGLATSVMLETFLLIRGQMDFRSALSTALGMSFISMLMMEISMEFTDLLFTKGELGLNYAAVPLMLIVGFLTPWPYNYWRLKKYGMACH